MLSTKVFTSGNSQAVRIPAELRMDDGEVYIQRFGKCYVITPKNSPWEPFLESLDEFPSDFMEDGRNQPAVQERTGI